MKKCKTVPFGSLPERNNKEKTCPLKICKKRIFSPMKKQQFPQKNEHPNAPHNTSQYIMDQHEPIYFDEEELLGNVLGIRTGDKK